ncbi:MAG: hypothetical protein U1F33_09200 [Alphaproteobacteria bacterium]
MRQRHFLGVLALAASLVACAPSQHEGAAASWIEHLDARARTCAREAAYKPIAPDAHRLADGEMAYRQCLYRAIDNAVASSGAKADRQALYRQLIAQDQALTTDVASGTISQAERTARLEQSKSLGDATYQDVVDMLTGERQQWARAQQLRDLRYLFELQQEVARTNLTLIRSGQ